MKSPSLQTRLLLAVLAPLVLVAVAITGFLVGRYVNDLRSNHEKRSEALVAQVQAAAGFALFVGDRVQLNELAASLLANDPLVYGVWIRDLESRVVVRMVRGAKPGTEASTPVPGLRTRWYSLRVKTGAAAGDAFLDGGATVVAGEHALGQIDVEYDDSALDRTVHDLLLVAGLVALGALLIGAALAIALARRISRPVLALSLAAKRISAGDLRARVEIERGGVLDELVENANAMAQTMEMAQENLRWRIAEATAELRSQRDAAERATEAKSRFLTAASHDLRQPLQALGLFTFRLRQEVPAPEAQALIHKIESSVISLQEMFGALLDLSSIDAHGVAVTRGNFHLREPIQRICGQMRPVADARGLDLRYRVGEDWVHADPILVSRILLNFISNSLKYTERGRITVRCLRRGERVRLSVWDSGIGIERRRQQEIFREFVQVGNDERNPAKGLGIGLAICRELAEAMGTSIKVRSTPGRGSLFYLDLPCAVVADADEGEDRAQVESDGARGVRVAQTTEHQAGYVHLLIADDDLAVRVRSQLETWQLRWRPFMQVLPEGYATVVALVVDQTALRVPETELLGEDFARQAPGAVVVVIADAAFKVPAGSSWARCKCIYLDRAAPGGRLRAALSAAARAASP